MRAEPIGADTIGRWADTMNEDLDRLLATGAPVLAPLAQRRAQVAATFDRIRRIGDGGLAIRFHGDYHLGQVLRTDSGWMILDFEGEPARSLAERRQRSSALRDVAGMLRSFDYAAAAALAERTRATEQPPSRLVAYGDAWAAANGRLFWGAYLARAGHSRLLPPDAADTVALRRAFEVQKAVYEVGYELGHRPDWVGIPLRFLLREVAA